MVATACESCREIIDTHICGNEVMGGDIQYTMRKAQKNLSETFRKIKTFKSRYAYKKLRVTHKPRQETGSENT